MKTIKISFSDEKGNLIHEKSTLLNAIVLGFKTGESDEELIVMRKRNALALMHSALEQISIQDRIYNFIHDLGSKLDKGYFKDPHTAKDVYIAELLDEHENIIFLSDCSTLMKNHSKATENKTVMA